MRLAFGLDLIFSLGLSRQISGVSCRLRMLSERQCKREFVAVYCKCVVLVDLLLLLIAHCCLVILLLLLKFE